MSDDRETPPIGRPNTQRPNQPRLKPQRSSTQAIVLMSCALVLALFGLVASVNSYSPSAATPYVRNVDSPVGRASDARTECRLAIRAALLVPNSARFSDYIRRDPTWSSVSQQWQWMVNVEAQNAFGVRIPNTWACEYRRGERA